MISQNLQVERIFRIFFYFNDVLKHSRTRVRNSLATAIETDMSAKNWSFCLYNYFHIGDSSNQVCRGTEKLQ